MSSTSFFLKTILNSVSKRNSFSSLRSVCNIYLPSNKCYHSGRIRLAYPQNLTIFKRMMATSPEIKNIGLEELKKYQENKIATIIDVREVDEIKESGSLPGGINIPLGDVGKALQEDPDIFEKKYNHPKPSLNSTIIFSCRSGRRSLMASQQAKSLGYDKVLNFNGGWIEWESDLSKKI